MLTGFDKGLWSPSTHLLLLLLFLFAPLHFVLNFENEHGACTVKTVMPRERVFIIGLNMSFFVVRGFKYMVDSYEIGKI